MSNDVYLRFAGQGPKLQFVEAENEDGESIDVGEWTDDGDDSILVIPRGDGE